MTILPRLLISLRHPAELPDCLTGGADLIDIKDPQRGSLGRATLPVLEAVLDAAPPNQPLSAALGELVDWDGDGLPPHLDRLHYIKWGLAGCGSGWANRLDSLRQRIESQSPCKVALTAYVDFYRAQSPPIREILHHAIQARYSVLLLDTCLKDGNRLTFWQSQATLASLIKVCHDHNIQIALAGSLGEPEIADLRSLRPDWFAVRGAACLNADREAAIDPAAVARLSALIRQMPER